MTPLWWCSWWMGACSTAPVGLLRLWHPVILRTGRSPFVKLAVETRRLKP